MEFQPISQSYAMVVLVVLDHLWPEVTAVKQVTRKQ